MNPNMHEELAVIQKATVGSWDGHLGLKLDVKLLRGGSVLFIPWDKSKEVLDTVEDSNRLNGKPVVVNTDGFIVTFNRLHQ